jgi:hypothetical protein
MNGPCVVAGRVDLHYQSTQAHSVASVSLHDNYMYGATATKEAKQVHGNMVGVNNYFHAF